MANLMQTIFIRNVSRDLVQKAKIAAIGENIDFGKWVVKAIEKALPKTK